MRCARAGRGGEAWGGATDQGIMEAEVLALKWNNHQSIFYHIISGLRTKGNYTDVTLACDGKFYPVHKLVLSTCSEYFSDIFDRTPCKNPVIVLKDIQCQDLEFLLDYMYIGEVNVRQNDLASLIKAAECLRVKGLAVPDDDGSKPQPQTPSVNTSSTTSRHRPPDTHYRDHTSPAAKRRRTEERRVSGSSSEAHQNPTSVDRSYEEATTSLTEQHDRHLHQTQHKGNVGMEVRLEAEEPGAIPNIKLEQDLGYNDNYDASMQSGTPSYDEDGYLHCAEKDSVDPKVEVEATSEGMAEDLGVTFSNMLQSSLTSTDGADHPSSLHPHVSLEAWEGGTGGRVVAGHTLQPSAAHTSPLTAHQQQKAAAAALGLLHSGGDAQTPLRLLPHQHGGTPFPQQNIMVGEALLSGEFLQQNDKNHRDYVCQFCGREFSHRTNLQAHLRIHTGEKPFHCLYCPYRTALKGNLKMHTISKHKADWKTIKHLVHAVNVDKWSAAREKEFGSGGELHCPICGRASSRRDNLERHIRSHLGDKPFKCPFCSFRSQLKWNMKSHIERRHPQTCAPPHHQ
ncbi:Protein tramtrack, alpha isoform [Chionoecetes opilio]|uniref:Protein tramtrack, alpha isoform n=1 Tax=Chionoecetes opilio TaxID=41210 RepID=A0A8J4Y5Q9_CHIOP|nr:Protein tramtrack, alpha isoform [Chionoecetes opilio]